MAQLKKIGFRTFDQWWSEDYDNEDDINVKLKLIMAELVRLSHLSTTDLINLRKEMTDVCKHNQEVYNIFRKLHNDQPNEPLYRIIKEIWNSF